MATFTNKTKDIIEKFNQLKSFKSYIHDIDIQAKRAKRKTSQEIIDMLVVIDELFKSLANEFIESVK
ncbi:MAG: hypothetical protein LBV53_02995 [Mycoplasmataceae bacterium]|jgi:uncharacterized protein with HEPN domain|nr:hypothetical protein [Mycoplasmataceae bacterium]